MKLKRPGIILAACFSVPVLMTITLAVLKLVGVVSWGWFWVFAPVIAAAILTIFIAVFLIVAVLLGLRWLSKSKDF